MKKPKINLNLRLILVLFLSVMFFFILTWVALVRERSIALKSYKTSIPFGLNGSIGRIVSPTQPTGRDINGRIVVTGVVRTTGLLSSEKQKLGLGFSNYFITDLNEKQASDLKINGYFLEGSDLFSRNYLGKCVKAEGTLVSGWEEVGQDYQKNEQFTYGNLAMIPENISPVSMHDCDPYKKITAAEKYFDLVSFSGTLKHSVRPAPDIGYDYLLFLDEEYLDESNPTGNPTYLLQIDVTPFGNDIWIVLEEKIGREVTLEGYYLWGWAESKYLEVHSIR